MIADNEISVVKTYKLGGFDQKVLLEGKTKDLPIVLTLHGGPGLPLPFCVGGRGLFPDFTDKCILVSWDQYGCGINNAVLPDEFTIDHFVEMTKDLICCLKQEFRNNKIYLFAMSWGSVLSAKTAVLIPEMLDGVMVYGQVLRNLTRTEEAIDELLKSKASLKVKEKMQTVLKDTSPDYNEAMVISKWIKKYTQGYINKSEPKMAMGGMVKGIMTSPDYRFKDVIAIAKNGYQKNRSLMKALFEIDLSETLTKVSIPYHMIQGDTDIITSTKEISQFVDECHNESLQLTVVKNAAHVPGVNGMDEIMRGLDRMFSPLRP